LLILGVYGTIAYRDKEVVGVFVRFSLRRHWYAIFCRVKKPNQ
jgi:hypothetical protein